VGGIECEKQGNSLPVSCITTVIVRIYLFMTYLTTLLVAEIFNVR
jgi:hypothetical protein